MRCFCCCLRLQSTGRRHRLLKVWRGVMCIALLVMLLSIASAYTRHSWWKGAWSSESRGIVRIPHQVKNNADRDESIIYRDPVDRDHPIDKENPVKTSSNHVTFEHTLPSTLLPPPSPLSNATHPHAEVATPTEDDHHHIKEVLAPPTLDSSGIHIQPKAPVVSEGHALKVVCASTQTMHQQDDNVPYVNFELPSMPLVYEQQISIVLKKGMAVLRFSHVNRRHEGTYKCLVSDATGKETYNTFNLKVIKKEADSEFDDERRGFVIDELPLDGNRLQENSNEFQHHKGADVLLKERLENLKRQFRDSNKQHVNMEELLEKGKFQQTQVEKYCVKYNLSSIAGHLPAINDSSPIPFYRHILVNDKTKTLYCFAPKAGCTNLRVLFFLVLGYIPLSQFLQSRDGVDQNKLEAAQFMESFYSRNDNQRLYALKHYFKFVMYRDPLERLVSGYRSKVARFPLTGLDKHKPHFNWLRKAILLQTHPDQYSQYLHARGKVSINISFTDFIDYWLQQPLELKYDEHFTSISSLCQPCRTQFSFYGNFKSFDTDSQVLVEKIKASPEFVRGGYYSDNASKSTSTLTLQLFSQLNEIQKQKLLVLLAPELDFYYHIFPEEVDSHKTVLGMNSDLPQPTS